MKEQLSFFAFFVPSHMFRYSLFEIYVGSRGWRLRLVVIELSFFSLSSSFVVLELWLVFDEDCFRPKNSLIRSFLANNLTNPYVKKPLNYSDPSLIFLKD